MDTHPHRPHRPHEFFRDRFFVPGMVTVQVDSTTDRSSHVHVHHVIYGYNLCFMDIAISMGIYSTWSFMLDCSGYWSFMTLKRGCLNKSAIDLVLISERGYPGDWDP